MTKEEQDKEIASIVGEVGLEITRLIHPNWHNLYGDASSELKVQNDIKNRWGNIATRVLALDQ